MPITFLVNGNAQLEEAPRNKSVRFGDGYQHVTPDGINTIIPRWKVVFDGLLKSELNQLLAELRTAHGAGPVQWQSPLDDAPLNYRVQTWSVTAKEGLIYDLNCTLERVIAP